MEELWWVVTNTTLFFWNLPWWGWVFVVIFLLYLAAKIEKRHMKCTWCNRGASDLEIIEELELHERWEHQKSDGSRDKRFKDNRLISRLRTSFLCNQCGATTKFTHQGSSVSDKVIFRYLLEDGDGERTGSDDW